MEDAKPSFLVNSGDLRVLTACSGILWDGLCEEGYVLFSAFHYVHDQVSHLRVGQSKKGRGYFPPKCHALGGNNWP